VVDTASARQEADADLTAGARCFGVECLAEQGPLAVNPNFLRLDDEGLSLVHKRTMPSRQALPTQKMLGELPYVIAESRADA